MGCGDEKLSKYLTQTFMVHCSAMICQAVTLSGDAEWPKVADAVIEAEMSNAVGDENPRLSGRCQDRTGPREGLPLVHDGVLRHVPGGEIRHEQRCRALVQCDLGHTSPPTLFDDPFGVCAESLRSRDGHSHACRLSPSLHVTA